MSRNLAIQILRGTQANLPTLVSGEFYFATDTQQLYVGPTPTIVGPLPGSLISVHALLTSGTLFTTGLTTHHIRVRVQAGGGAGGGVVATSSTTAAAGSGGNSGGYAEKYFSVTPNTGYSYAIGAGGTGVSAANGNSGGNTTFTVGAATVTAFGGQGGGGGAAVAAGITPRVSATLALSTGGDLNGAGIADGDIGIVLSKIITTSGRGGNSLFGFGGLDLETSSSSFAGQNATGFGAGGGGAVGVNSVARAGGSGTPGCILIEEYS